MDATRLLGSLLRGSMGRGMSQQAGLALGMGVVGVAMAAFEHYSAQRQAVASGPPATLPPPLPAAHTTEPSFEAPPPLPATPPLARPTAPVHSDAMILIRAMVAAAWADGALDQSERAAITQRLATAGLPDDEQAFVASELEHPASLESLLAECHGRELAEQMYAASLLAIRVDSAAERAYLQRLAAGLKLGPDDVGRIARLLGVTP
jgi:uncharacterized membrane protein YebE (DUF533 family)